MEEQTRNDLILFTTFGTNEVWDLIDCNFVQHRTCNIEVEIKINYKHYGNKNPNKKKKGSTNDDRRRTFGNLGKSKKSMEPSQLERN
jgi:hypothetical protein